MTSWSQLPASLLSTKIRIQQKFKLKPKKKPRTKSSKRGEGERKKRKNTHIIPIRLTKLNSRRPPLDPRAIDQHVDLAAHDLEGLVEDLFDGGEVGYVAFDDLC